MPLGGFGCGNSFVNYGYFSLDIGEFTILLGERLRQRVPQSVRYIRWYGVDFRRFFRLIYYVGDRSLGVDVRRWLRLVGVVGVVVRWRSSVLLLLTTSMLTWRICSIWASRCWRVRTSADSLASAVPKWRVDFWEMFPPVIAPLASSSSPSRVTMRCLPNKLRARWRSLPFGKSSLSNTIVPPNT